VNLNLNATLDVDHRHLRQHGDDPLEQLDAAGIAALSDAETSIGY
jgi:hypothetical protein